MNEYLSPKTLHQPGGVYSHTVHVPANSEWAGYRRPDRHRP